MQFMEEKIENKYHDEYVLTKKQAEIARQKIIDENIRFNEVMKMFIPSKKLKIKNYYGSK